MPSAEEKLVAFFGRPAPGLAPPRVDKFDFFGISNAPCQTSRWEPVRKITQSVTRRAAPLAGRRVPSKIKRKSKFAQPLGIEPSQQDLESRSPALEHWTAKLVPGWASHIKPPNPSGTGISQASPRKSNRPSLAAEVGTRAKLTATGAFIDDLLNGGEQEIRRGTDLSAHSTALT